MTINEIKTIIALGEGFSSEFKKSASDKKSIGREICAFANATGGVLLIGVADDGEIVGVDHHNKLKSEIQSIVRSIEPPLVAETYSIESLVAIVVPSQNAKPYSYAGKFYLRDGTSSQQLSRNEIREFFFKEGVIHFDEKNCNSFVLDTDLTERAWSKFQKTARIPTSMPLKDALSNLHLLKQGEMTNAGAWLLCEDIKKYNISGGVICALFMGTTKLHILDRVEFAGDIYGIFEEVSKYLFSKLNTELIITGTGRDERLEL
ncbi:MAG: hypothetical protein GXP32_04075, partial [Kiritimatiellaeota bacterium]|nr:hypothetical protein [Kiritimatiellota bacterium]